MSKKRGNGEGSIVQRPDGVWEARLTLSGGRRKSFYSKSRQTVARKLAEALRDRERGLSLITDERLTVAAYLASWLERMAPPRVRPSTHRGYVTALAHVTAAYGELRLTRLTAAHLADLYASLQRPPAPPDSSQPDKGVKRSGRALSATTVHLTHVVLRKALADAVKLDLLASNVTDRVDAPRPRRPPVEPLSPDEARRFLEAARGERLEALYTLAITSGMRLGELLALTWRAVDLEAGSLQVIGTLQRGANKAWEIAPPKTSHSRRQIALTPLAVDALRAHRARQRAERLALGDVWVDRDLVFCDELGGFLNGTVIERYAYQRVLTRAGLPHKTFHSLRHTAATLLLGQRVHPKVVSEMLGHATIGITLDLYSHALPDMQREAAGALESVFRRGGRGAG